MRDAVDATGVDKQPVRQYNKWAYVFFIVFVIVGSFVILNLFISVMIDNFYALKKQQVQITLSAHWKTKSTDPLIYPLLKT